jgi:fused signal recognition particle receptor
MFDLFKKLKDSLVRTRETLTEGVRQVLSGFRPLDDALFEDLEEVLIGADVGVATTEKLLERVRARAKSTGVRDSSGVEALLRAEVEAMLSGGATGGATGSAAAASGASGSAATRGGAASTATASMPTSEAERPRVVIVIGVNGVGKTTSIGKLAHRWKSDGRRVLIAASDTFRAAASEQLSVWAERAGVDIVRSTSGADPAAVAYDGLTAAISRGADVLIVDTAGRLQTKLHLMEELKKIGRVLSRQMPGAPHEVLLVLDASTGQNAVVQAREFGLAVGVTGLVLTKLDGTAKGGVVLAIADQLGLPVRWIGVGEGIEDLAEFDPAQFAAALFEMPSS